MLMNDCSDTQNYPMGNILFTALAFKNIFGIGAKKAAFKQMEAEAGGKWTTQFPPSVDWNEYLKKFGGAVQKVYDAQRGKKDSLLLKNGIATPQDFAAWHAATYGLVGAEGLPAHCDPNNTNPNSPFYKWCPVYRDSGINIFDNKRIDEWAAKKNVAPPKKKAVAPLIKDIKPPERYTPTAIRARDPDFNRPPELPTQTPVTNLGPSRIFSNIFPQQPIPVGPIAQSPALPSWAIPAMLAAGVGIVFFAQKKGRR